MSLVDETFCFDSIVCGHHVSKTVCSPFLGEILETGEIVGHVLHDRVTMMTVKHVGSVILSNCDCVTSLGCIHLLCLEWCMFNAHSLMSLSSQV